MRPEASRDFILGAIRRISLSLLLPALLNFAPAASQACNADLHTSALSQVPGYLAILDSQAAGAGVIYGGTFRVCGAPSAVDPYVQHGHPTTNGSMTFSINDEFDMTFEIDLGTTQEYLADHAHFYNPNNGYANSDVGESTICWAGVKGATALQGSAWPGNNGFYRDWLEQVALDNGAGWWLNVHMIGGHFATDEDGHLIEWTGEFASFGGTNTIKPECDAHQRRKLDNKALVFDNSCSSSQGAGNAADYFLDQMGVAWVDSNGDLTADAIEHEYDLDTDYLFFQFGDEGRSNQWGGPDGGIGGRLDGSEDARCDSWPVAGWGDPHSHGAGGGGIPAQIPLLPAWGLLSLALLLLSCGGLMVELRRRRNPC
jgi:hypothetical protein